MIIYCNGDSYVAGTELADFELPLHPGYFSELSIHRSKSINSVVENWSKIIKNHHTNIHRRDYGRHLAFPSKIKNKFVNETVINEATAGYSIDQIVQTSIMSLIKLMSEHPKSRIIAIIGTTAMSRFIVPVTKHGSSRWASVITTAAPQCPPLHTVQGVEPLVKYMVTNDSDYHQYVRFYKNIIQLQDFCKLNRIVLYWVHALPIDGSHMIDCVNTTSDKLQTLLATTNCTKLESLVKYANLNYSVDMQLSSTKISTNKRFCPQDHFVEEVHSVVANELCELILKEHQ
jgi:hypothetical protein